MIWTKSIKKVSVKGKKKTKDTTNFTSIRLKKEKKDEKKMLTRSKEKEVHQNGTDKSESENVKENSLKGKSQKYLSRCGG